MRTIFKFIFLIIISYIFVTCNSKNKRLHIDNPLSQRSDISISTIDSQCVEDLSLLCKIWGFLKYYHPSVATGKYNWDEELYQIMPLVIDSQSKNQRNQILYTWIVGLGDFDQSTSSDINSDIKQQPDILWINDEFKLGKVSKLLKNLKNAYRRNRNYYVALTPISGNPNFKNEESYSDIPYPDTGLRLLALFRYWNIIQYYYPYRYQIEGDWQDILPDFIPLIINANNALEYRLVLLKLIAAIGDTHAVISSDSILMKWKGLNNIPVDISFIENKAVVTSFFDGFNSYLPFKKGDIILSVDNVSIDSIICEKAKYCSASNNSSLLTRLASELFRTNNDSLYIKYERNGIFMYDTVNSLPVSRVGFSTLQKNKPAYSILSGSILYIYPGSLRECTIPDMFNIKGVIIDLRCYPSFKVDGFPDYNQLMPRSVEFANSTIGSIINPGLFTFRNPIKIGKNYVNYYKGKLIVLVNENTISHAEFLTMLYRKVPNACIIGTNTAGADGDVSIFSLPGGIKTTISGIGIYYPDGRETQGIGIIPDIEVKPTIKGIRENRDEVLEKAIGVIQNIK